MNVFKVRAKLLNNTKTDNGCLLWTKTPHKRGYGRMKIDGKSLWVHRVAYEIFNETTIPDGLTVDHLCFNKLCINPKHLEAVTLEENNRRWYSKFLKDNPNFPCGHPRSGDIVIYKNKTYKSGTIKYQKRCEKCWKEYQREYHKDYNAKTE